ncbi:MULTISPECIES: hypothetical protein [Aequorivita]|uniref:Uncharacterized protein n=2 Tax=Aequorivita TaxID=153265 RepID=A0AB35YT40_9FLAO|nr:hypothetical protein [Aequorivita sp. Ant34-E75]WGF92145.1 hypothetical protein QCQ61_13150 [Aequorivita sp. Ant34-E75]
MKKGSNIFINLIFFLGGCLITYFALQYSYFNINTEVNVVETLLSLIIALIGLYIAISIQKKYNKNQSLHSIVQSKMDNIWNGFSIFDNQLNDQNTIQLKIVTKSFKSLYKELNNLKIVFTTFNLNATCINKLEKSMEAFDTLITSDLPISNNVIKLSNHKTVIKDQSNLIHQDIVNSLKEINDIL